MFSVYIIDKVTKKEMPFICGITEDEAETICESWGWMYSDENGKSFWMEILEGV